MDEQPRDTKETPGLNEGVVRKGLACALCQRQNLAQRTLQKTSPPFPEVYSVAGREDKLTLLIACA
eukprot:5938377-Amphidinium_carterae.1